MRIIRNIIVLISVVSVGAVAVIDRGQAVHRGALGAPACRPYRGVMVNDPVDLVSLAIVCINPG